MLVLFSFGIPVIGLLFENYLIVCLLLLNLTILPKVGDQLIVTQYRRSINVKSLLRMPCSKIPVRTSSCFRKASTVDILLLY
jgi:hypothetical protein